MKLTALYLRSFRRFEEETKIDLAPKVVALVGPNEAGKSSILRALSLLGSEGQLETRYQSRDSTTEPSIEAHFVLEEEDRTALASVPGGNAVRRYVYEMRIDRGRLQYYFRLDPSPRRDLSGRREARQLLERLVHEENIRNRHQQALEKQVSEVLDGAMDALGSEVDSLALPQLQAIRTFADVMFAFPDLEPQEGREPETTTVSEELVSLLRSLQNYDEGTSPLVRAGEILGERRPEFFSFTEEDRELKTVYNLDDDADRSAKALVSLASLAELDLQSLRDWGSPNFAGERVTTLNRANRKLERRFASLWPQHDLTVQLSFNSPNLEITVSSPGDSFSGITERSDGLRSFIALRSFLATRMEGPSKPILLVDEAETHLHYDAQANLVDMFTRQDLVAKVIYSTHSAGCLPTDLGYGIRVVAPIENQERSTVRKSIWDGRFAGFSPLVFAMGATTFAFLPSRNVLMVEGESDAMLLPSLLRESQGLESLPFQVAPGLSVVSHARASTLVSEGGSVLYLVDGDGGGEELRVQLFDAGVKKRDVYSLREVFGADWVLEDLIEPTRYIESANWVVANYLPSGTPLMTEKDLNYPKCTDALKKWCKANGLKELDRVVIAQRLLDIKAVGAEDEREVALLNPASKVRLRQLLGKIAKRFPDAPDYK